LIGDLSVGLVIPAYNEAESLRRILPQVPADLVDLTLVVNDGSTDTTSDSVRKAGARLLERTSRGGPGPAIRDGLDLLRREGIDVAVIMASNGKHDPGQIAQLLEPFKDGYELVRGSRQLAGGGHQNMPWHRLWLIRLFTLLFSILSGRRVTDATGGYQAYRLRVLDDPRIDLRQSWLGRYEIETYIFAKMLMLGYRWKEVPVTITYPSRGKPYTRARMIVDWWGYFRPVLLLRLGLKH
jgi:dolichol-phosphate mannosyltransferase